MLTRYHLDHSYFSDPCRFGDFLLYQIGRQYCERDTVVEAHIHMPFFELTIVTEGHGTVITNGVGTPVSRGDIYFSLPCDTHEIRVDPDDPLQYDYIAFHCNTPSLQTEFEHLTENYHSPYNRVVRDDHIRRAVGYALSELNEERPYSAELLAALLTQISVCLIRDCKKIPPTKTRDTVTPAEVLCYRLMHHVDTHIYSMKHLEELADAIGYSYGYLSALFKRTTDRTLSDYYQEKRLDAAGLLLREGRFSVTAVADMLNYASVYSFSKAFRKRYGASPRIWRENIIKNE